MEIVVFGEGVGGQRARGTEKIRASVEVKDDNRVFLVALYAENLRQAVEFAASRYPGYAVSVRFPLNPEVFFVKGSVVGSETVKLLAAKGSQQERDLGEAAETPAACRRWGSTVGAATGPSMGELAAS